MISAIDPKETDAALLFFVRFRLLAACDLGYNCKRGGLFMKQLCWRARVDIVDEEVKPREPSLRPNILSGRQT
jgi:hypothetical protein